MTLVPTSRTALCTHRGCLDGTGSAFMFILAGGLRKNIIFRTPAACVLKVGDLPEDVDEVWFADCCPNDLTDPACGLPFRVFDHHLSSQRLFGTDPRCTFDLERSGTSLMAHVLGRDVDPYPECVVEFQVPLLVEALEAYDLGRFDNAAGMRLADLASTLSQDEMLDVLVRNSIFEVLNGTLLTERANAAASIRQLYADAVESRGAVYDDIEIGSSDLRVGVCVSPVYWKNEVAMRILNSGKAELAIILDPTAGMVSLRSKEGGPDCSLIAGLYGGGGHARAAGFKMNRCVVLRAMMEEVLG